MNKIEELENIPTREELLMVINQIEKVIINSYKMPKNMYQNINMLDKIENVFKSLNYNSPYAFHALREFVIRKFYESRPLEADVYLWFIKNIDTVLRGYHISNKKSNRYQRPDFWVENDVERIPVEIKLTGIGTKALKQIQRYMKFYNCSKGILIGNELCCDIPKSVIFIKHRVFEEQYLI